MVSDDPLKGGLDVSEAASEGGKEEGPLDYGEEELREVELRYRGLDDEMKVEAAKILAYVKRSGYPSIMAHAKVTDPRFLIFLDWVMNQKFESLEEAKDRLKISWKILERWWNFLKENGYIKPEVVEYYESRPKGPLGSRREMEGSRLQPPRSSSTRREETLSMARDMHGLVGMSEEGVKTVEIPEDLLYRMIRAAILGDKRELANTLSEFTKYRGDMGDVIREFIERYGARGQSAGPGLGSGGVINWDELANAIAKSYVTAFQLQAFRDSLLGGGVRINPDGSISVSAHYPPLENHPAIRRLEERLEKLAEILQKREEESRFKALEERLNQLAEKLLEKGGKAAGGEIEALREELRKLREERLKEDLKEAIEDLKEVLEAALSGRGGQYDIIDAVAKLNSLYKEKDMEIEELKAKLEKARDESLAQTLNGIQEQIRTLRARLEEVSKNPLQAYRELAEQAAELEQILNSLRKGSTPAVDQDVKQRAMNMLQELVGKVTDVLLAQRSPRTAMDLGVKLASVPCSICGKPIPVPDVMSVNTLTCPHCGQMFAVDRKPVAGSGGS